MKLRRRALLLATALLGAAVAVLPAVAGSETAPAITATNSEGAYGEQQHRWNPQAATVTAGGNVSFSNPTEVSHGLEWTGGPAIPACSGVPAGSFGATHWTGQCMFTQSGTYAFRCTVHPYEMTGTITVTAASTTTAAGPTTTVSPPPQVGAGGAPSPTSGASVPASPLAGSASQALSLKRAQRGNAVRGSISLSQAGAGARLEVELLARPVSLAAAEFARQVRAGRLVRRALQPGRVSFRVPLNARARRALRVHRRLALAVKVTLSPALGATVRVNRAVVLRP